MEEKVEGWTGHRGIQEVAGPRFRLVKIAWKDVDYSLDDCLLPDHNGRI